jgi:hypothetical protein
MVAGPPDNHFKLPDRRCWRQAMHGAAFSPRAFSCNMASKPMMYG